LKESLGFIAILLFLIALIPAGYSLASSQMASTGAAANLKIMAYNIHHAVGMDGVLNTERIARTIEVEGADIIGLQEVDNHWSKRSNFENQAKWLAERLDMHYTYMANLDLDPLISGNHRRQYGAAILSKYPIIQVHNHPLRKIGDAEQRGLMETVINVQGHKLNVYNTHLSLTSSERQIQVNEIMKIAGEANGAKVIMGDLNTTPESNEILPLTTHYKDTLADQHDAYTYSVEGPPKRIDYIFTSKEIKTTQAKVISTLASDHFPLTAKLTLHS
jgi:endonuclease/exonuclease/phosphatase family metal-dependent hydrolase